jgi:hypothetical protein
MGQSRRFGDVRVTSALLLIADVRQRGRQVRKVPISDIERFPRTERLPTEAALLLLRVKRGLLSLHLLHQFFNPINRKLVGDRSGYALVVFDLAVEFDTLVAHFLFRIRAKLATDIGCRL